MSTKNRTRLFHFFVFLFFVITPLIYIYASGYKIKSGFKLEKTGMLTIGSKPKDANIYINGKLQQTLISKILNQETGNITTPAKLKNLLPGEYEVELSKEGYWSWKKRLKILPGQSTFAENVILFRNKEPLSLSTDKYEILSISPDKNTFVGINENGGTIINLDSGEISRFEASTENESKNIEAQWSPKKQKVILNRQIIDISNTNNNIELDKLIGSQGDNFKWNNQNNNSIYYTSNGKINLYDLNNDSSRILISDEISGDYLAKDDIVFYTHNGDENSYLKIFHESENRLIREINLPKSTYKFLDVDHKLINLFDEKNNILYLIDAFSNIKPIREVISNINEVYWVNENKLLYANDFEIWTLELNSFKKTLLTRISNNIEHIIWHPSDSYVVFSTESDINIIELDERGRRNIIKITEAEKISEVSMNKKGTLLYFHAEGGKLNGVNKLMLQ